jgi:protein-tyrosine-phosphatase
MNERVYNVLFLCTHNSARSVLAEAILRHEGQGRFRSFSAGSFPRGEVNPLALRELRLRGLPAEGYRSKSWDEFSAPDAPQMDLIITVCDDAAGEVCPVWPGKPLSAHWGIPDPSTVAGTEMERQRAFTQAASQLARMVSYLVALPLAKLDTLTVAAELQRARKAADPTGAA